MKAKPNTSIQTALVTGASRGLGRALAGELARRGVRVALVGRDEAAIRQAADEIRAEGGEASAFAVDIGKKEQIHPLVYRVNEVLGAPDLVVHNASSLGPVPMPLLSDLDCEDFSEVLEVNLLGPFRLTKLVAPAMALRGRGAVVFVSSDAATSAYPGWGAYGVSKAALDHLARSFAAEHRGSGVSFIAIDPGEMDTQMHRDAMPESDPSTLRRPEIVAAYLAEQLLQVERETEARWSPSDAELMARGAA